MADPIHIIDNNILAYPPAQPEVAVEAPIPEPPRNVNPNIEAINAYMQNPTPENLEQTLRYMRENHVNPTTILYYALSVGNAPLIEGLFSLVGNTRQDKVNLANYYPGDSAWGETPLTTALTNPNDENIIPILEVLLKNGANPNLETDGRSNFFDSVYQDEQDSQGLGDQDRLDYLQRVRNLVRQYNHECPERFRRHHMGGKRKKKKTKRKKRI